MRSGTTWIGKVLDSSPEVVYLHEPDYVKRIPCLPYTTEAQDYLGWESYMRRYLEGLRSTCSSRSILKRPLFSKNFPKSLAQKASYQAFLGKMQADQVLSKIGFAPMVSSWPSCVDQAQLTVWKSVEQTGNIGCFLHAIPEQKIIHVVRHPCGFVDSVMRGQQKKLLHGGVPTSQDLGIFDYVVRTSFAQRIGLRLRDWEKLSEVERLAYIWLVLNEQAILDGVGRSNYKLVYFEEFCLDPMQLTCELMEFAGLSFDHQTERFVCSSSNFSGRGIGAGKSTTEDYYSVSRNSQEVPRSWEGRLSKDSIHKILQIARISDQMTQLLGKQIGQVKPRVD